MFPLFDPQSRPTPANAIISSTNFPDEMQQDFLVCNVIGHLGVFRYKLHRDGYTENDKQYQIGEIRGSRTDDFVSSKDRNFRPTDVEFGADGAMYLADWHNAIIGHMQHNMRDPKRDGKHGRIFRIVCKERSLQDPVSIDGESIPSLLENLKHPTNGVRERTRIELSEHQPGDVATAVQSWIEKLDPQDPNDAHPLLEALWVLQQNHIKNQALLDSLAQSPEPHARIAAATVRHFWESVDPIHGHHQNQPLADEEKKIQVQPPDHLSDTDAKIYQLGAQVYHREGHCATCHQAHGRGLDPAFPPLAGSSWVSGSEERLTKITLHGLWGRIEVNGKIYDPANGVPPMTAFESLLDDHEIAAVLTYIRNSWNNRADPV
ncbi:MAG: DUF7133 domain-containing protein, partial [Luteolibacter sp.]